MAIYHLSARIVSRAKGQSAVHKAAYNARTQLRDEREGRTSRDYSAEGGLLFSGIFAPKGAPDWVQDREQLWNRVEAAEKRKDAFVAREIEIALPHELTEQQREWLVKDFVREQFVRRGMVADVAIHAPDLEGDERNYHAHILLTTRQLDGEDFAKTKTREWDTKATLYEWRQSWERTTNRYLERFGHEEHIDHRTLEAQGIDREATIHLGPHVQAMEARGLFTERGEQLRGVEARNYERAELTQGLQQVDVASRALDEGLTQTSTNVVTGGIDILGQVAEKTLDTFATAFDSLFNGRPPLPPDPEQLKRDEAVREQRAEQREAKAAAEELYRYNTERQRQMEDIIKKLKAQEEEYEKQRELDGGRSRTRER